jgi:V8-like Glu-specific endopeptidase
MKQRRVATLCFAVAATTAVVFIAPAQAASAALGPAAPQSPVAAQARTEGATTQATAESYWTPQRMRDAVPADKLAPTSSTPSTRDSHATGAPSVAAAPYAPSTGAAEGLAPRAAAITPDAVTPDAITPDATTPDAITPSAVNASTTVGKIFFHNASDGRNYVCSGSTINNPKNIVVTAGHCVHGGRGGAWHTNWVFVPYYDHGNRPYGTWSAKQLTSFLGWTRDGNRDWDVAFVNVWPNGSTRLVDRVGGNGLTINYPKNLYVTLLAYPAAPPFDGQWQHYCQGNMYAYGSQQVGFNCLLTGGASGGPFLYQYNNNTGLGFVDSVISHGPDTINYGPYFDTDVNNLYNGVKNYA